MQAENRISSLWQQRLDSIREYEVVRDGNIFGAGLVNNCLFSSEYEKAKTLLDNLLNQYRDVSFETLFSGREITNDNGSCFVLETIHDLPKISFDPQQFKKDLERDLTLVRGIGKISEYRLNLRGCHTISELSGHPRFSQGARVVMDRLYRGNPVDLLDLIVCRHSPSHRLAFGTAGLIEPEKFLFLDIETLGLFSRPIILFGIGSIENNRFVVRQYLVRDICEEASALSAMVARSFPGQTVMVTFNGKSFDLPYIQDRLAYYGLKTIPRGIHFDMLHFSRRQWKGQLSSCRLCNLESAILGLNRIDDLPGQMVPEFYESYLKTQNFGPLLPIVEHNRQDVVSLGHLFFYLLKEYYGNS